jgi:hypothetical protein
MIQPRGLNCAGATLLGLLRMLFHGCMCGTSTLPYPKTEKPPTHRLAHSTEGAPERGRLA